MSPYDMDEYLNLRACLMAVRFSEMRAEFSPERGFPRIVEADTRTVRQAEEELGWVREQFGEELSLRLIDGSWAYQNLYWMGYKGERLVGLVVAEPCQYNGEEALRLYFAFKPGQKHLYEEAELYVSYAVTTALDLGVDWLYYEVTDSAAWFIRGLEDQGFIPTDFDEQQQPHRFELRVRTPRELHERWDEMIRELRARPVWVA